MKTLSLLCLMAVAVPALALALVEKPVSPSEFREYAEGHTLYFDLDGEPEYLLMDDALLLVCERDGGRIVAGFARDD